MECTFTAPVDGVLVVHHIDGKTDRINLRKGQSAVVVSGWRFHFEFLTDYEVAALRYQEAKREMWIEIEKKFEPLVRWLVKKTGP